MVHKIETCSDLLSNLFCCLNSLRSRENWASACSLFIDSPSKPALPPYLQDPIAKIRPIARISVATFNHPIGQMRRSITRWAPTLIVVPVPPHSLHPHRFPVAPCIPTMTDKPQRPKERDGALSALNVAIDGLNFAKELADITPAKAAVGSVAILLTMIRVGFLLFCDETPRVHT